MGTPAVASAGHVAVGEILGPYGIRGGVWVRPLTGNPERARGLSDVVLLRGDEAAPARMTGVRVVEGRWIVTFAGFATREEAEGLRGWRVGVPATATPPLPPGTFYVDDLVGRSVVAEDGTALGRIASVVTTGASDVYVIESDEGELLFPALKALVLEVPREPRTMRVRVPAGLLESCFTRRSAS